MNKTERKPLIKTDRYASEIGRNGDPKRINLCGVCGHPVVWCKSVKTGKFYLVSVTSNGSGNGSIYNAGNPHYKTCESDMADRAEMTRRDEVGAKRRTNMRQFIEATQALQAEGKFDEVDALTDRFDATGEVN